jgi:NADH-quinone oxidoreductase subunit J
MLDTFLFYAFALLVLGGGVLTITRRNAVHSAVWLIVSLLGVAGLYLLQQAEFLFAVQIVLYVGGIMVLFLFVIMLLTTKDEEFARARMNVMHVGGVLGALGVLVVVVKAVSDLGPMPMRLVGPEFGTVKAVGRLLYTQYVLPFEVTSLLLLVSIVGAVVVAKQRI